MPPFTIRLSKRAEKDLDDLLKEDVKLGAKFLKLLQDIRKNPYKGIGKPEALKHDMQGWWSRRINQEHRFVYRLVDDIVDVACCYGHY